MKDLDGLNAAYASMRESDQPMLLTKADKTGNTPAWRNRHKKSVKTGKPLYKMAGHLKDEYESELWNTVSKNLTELHQLGGVQFKVVPLDEGAVKKELKALSKAGETGKGKYVKKADEIEEQKDTPDQVKAVIAYDKARKGTEDAVYDTEHGKKKQAKKERDYAKWQRDKGAEDAQKSGHPWEHAKGSTREKEGKKSVKHAHIKDDKDWGYDKKGNSLNPVDQMKKKRKDDDLFGSPKKKVKEDFNQLISSGKFSKEEINRIAWNDFDESVEHRRNPEKYHDSEGHDKKLERDKPYAKRSRAARMADPERGINSPAFKKFMADRGM